MSLSAWTYQAKGQESGGEKRSAAQRFYCSHTTSLLAGGEKPPGGAWRKGKRSCRAEIKSLGEYFHPPLIIFSIRHTSFGRKRFSRFKREGQKQKRGKKTCFSGCEEESEDRDVWQHGMRKYILSRTNCCYNKICNVGAKCRVKKKEKNCSQMSTLCRSISDKWLKSFYCTQWMWH